MFSELTREELAAGLDAVAEALLQEAGIVGPPVDATALARGLGIAVAIDDRQAGRGRCVRLAGRGARGDRAAILIRPDPRRERRQWAIAHEIGEHAAHRVFAQFDIDPRAAAANARERAADWLAGRLLLPTEWFAADGTACGWDLFVLKARYATASHELIARRMLECRPAVVVSIFDAGRLSFRRGNTSDRAPPPPSRAELECRSAVHDRCRPMQTRRDGMRVQGWPIHEDGWQREILRTEIEECDGSP